MADSAGAVTEAEWCANLLYDHSSPVAGANAIATAVDLDEGTVAPPIDRSRAPNAGAKRAAVVLGVGLMGAISLIVATLRFSGAPDDPPVHRAPPPKLSAAPAPPGSPGVAEDQAVAFTASADCPAGSTSAQSLTDTTHDSAWVCVRGPAGAAVDGQVLHVDFGTSRVLTAVTVTPGWVAKTVGGQDEWLQHRVVSRLQYCFNDDEHTMLVQDTGDVHGPVTQPLSHPVMASQVIIIVLQTARPPASPPTSSGPRADGPPGLPDWSGPVGEDPTGLASAPGLLPTVDLDPGADPVDATFAMSGLQFFGHSPR